MVRFDCLCVVSTRLLVAMVCILPLMSSVWATAVDVRMPEMVDVQSLAVTATTPKTMGEDFSVTLISPKQITFTSGAIFAVKAQLHGNAVVDRHIVMQAVTNADSTCKLDKDTATATFTDKGVAVFKAVMVLATQDVVSPECTFEFILTGATADDTYTTTVNIAVDTTGHDKRITWDMQPSSNTFLSGLETRVVITPKANDTPLPDSPGYTVSIEVAPSSKNSCVLKFTVVPSDVINGQASARLILQSSHASASPVLCDLELTLKQEDVHGPISTKVWSVKVVRPVYDLHFLPPSSLLIDKASNVVLAASVSGIPLDMIKYTVKLTGTSACDMLILRTDSSGNGRESFSVKVPARASLLSCTLTASLFEFLGTVELATATKEFPIIWPVQDDLIVSFGSLQSVVSGKLSKFYVSLQNSRNAYRYESFKVSIAFPANSDCTMEPPIAPVQLTSSGDAVLTGTPKASPVYGETKRLCPVEVTLSDDVASTYSFEAVGVYVFSADPTPSALNGKSILTATLIILSGAVIVSMIVCFVCARKRRQNQTFHKFTM